MIIFHPVKPAVSWRANSASQKKLPIILPLPACLLGLV